MRHVRQLTLAIAGALMFVLLLASYTPTSVANGAQVSGSVRASAPSPVPGTSPRISMYYYGTFDATVKQRLIKTRPAYVVMATPGSSYKVTNPTAADIADLKASGIKVFAYISTGNLVGYKYSADSPPNDRTFVRTAIASVAAAGVSGIFFDEGGVGNWRDPYGRWTGTIADRFYAAPATDMNGKPNSWAGYTVEDYASYAHSFGLMTVLGTDFYAPKFLNPNVFDIFDFVMTDENYTPRTPSGSEVGHESQCWVIGAGVNDAATAAQYTNYALNQGFGAAYETLSLRSLESWYETYVSLVSGSSTATNPTPASYSLTVSVSGQGTTTGYTPGIYQVSSGTTVTIGATPAPGWVFKNWSNYPTWTENPVSWTMMQATNITAVFTQSATAPTTPSNSPPVLAPIGNKTVAQGSQLQFTISATDPNGNPLTYSASGLPAGATFSPATQVFTWTPTTAGTYSSIAFQVSDGSLADSESIAVTVTPVNASTSGGTKYQLTVVVQGQGTTTGYAPGIYQIPAGTIVTIGATPAPGWVFQNWSNYPTWNENPTSWTMVQSVTVTAVFQPSGIQSAPQSPSGVPPASSSAVNATTSASIGAGSAATPVQQTQQVSGVGGAASVIPHDSVPPVISDVVFTDITETSATISWITDEATAGVVEYVNGSDRPPFDTDNYSTKHSFGLVGLIPITEYHVKLLARDRDGNVSESDEYSFNTEGQAARFVVGALRVSPDKIESKQSTTAIVTVTNVGDVAGTYEVNLSLDSAAGSEKMTREVRLGPGESQEAEFLVNPSTSGVFQVSAGALTSRFVVEPEIDDTHDAPQILGFVATPSYDESGRVGSVGFAYSLLNPSVLDAEARLVLKVELNGRPLEDMALFSGSLGSDQTTNGTATYVPSQGWTSGKYAFRAELVSTDRTSPVASEQTLDMMVGSKRAGDNQYLMAMVTGPAGVALAGAALLAWMRRRIRNSLG